MVRRGEHTESIITNCSSAMKGNHAIFLPSLCIYYGEAIETSLTRLSFVSPGYQHKKNNPKPHHFPI